MKEELASRFAAVEKSLPQLRQKFAAQVVRWIFSKAKICSADDLALKLDGILPGPENAEHACGLDVSGRPVLIQEFYPREIFERYRAADPAFSALHQEEFITHHPGVVESEFFLRGKLHTVSRYTFENGLPTTRESFSDGVYHRAAFQYDGHRLCLEQRLNEEGRVCYEVTHDTNGHPSFFMVRRDGTRFQLHQPWPKGVTLKSVKETIRARLLTLVPQIVGNAGIKEPIYCVVLTYDHEGNDPLPPVIGVGLESERARWMAEHGKRARHWIWNPAEFQHYGQSNTAIEDQELEEACDLLNSKLAEGDSIAPAIKLLVDVAAELNRRDWPETLQRTPDFVVYAVDQELGSLRKNLRACLPEDRFRALQASKLI